MQESLHDPSMATDHLPIDPNFKNALMAEDPHTDDIYDSDSSYHTAPESPPSDNDLQESIEQEIAYLLEEEKTSQQIRQNLTLEIEHRRRKESQIRDRISYLQHESRAAKVTKKQVKLVPQRPLTRQRNTIISAKEVDVILNTVTSTSSSSSSNQRESILKYDLVKSVETRLLARVFEKYCKLSQKAKDNARNETSSANQTDFPASVRRFSFKSRSSSKSNRPLMRPTIFRNQTWTLRNSSANPPTTSTIIPFDTPNTTGPFAWASSSGPVIKPSTAIPSSGPVIKSVQPSTHTPINQRQTPKPFISSFHPFALSGKMSVPSKETSRPANLFKAPKNQLSDASRSSFVPKRPFVHQGSAAQSTSLSSLNTATLASTRLKRITPILVRAPDMIDLTDSIPRHAPSSVPSSSNATASTLPSSTPLRRITPNLVKSPDVVDLTEDTDKMDVDPTRLTPATRPIKRKFTAVHERSERALLEGFDVDEGNTVDIACPNETNGGMCMDNGCTFSHGNVPVFTKKLRKVLAREQRGARRQCDGIKSCHCPFTHNDNNSYAVSSTNRKIDMLCGTSRQGSECHDKNCHYLHPEDLFKAFYH